MKTKKRTKTFYRYFPAANRDHNWGLYVTTMGASKIGPNTPYPPPGHPEGYIFPASGRVLPEYQIIYISSGSGWFKSAKCRKRPVTAGQVILLFPGVRHDYAPSPDTGWDEHWIGFKGDIADDMLRSGFFAPDHPVLQAGDDAGFLALFKDIVKTARDNPPALQQALAGLTMNALALLYSQRQFNLAGDEPELKAVQAAVAQMRQVTNTPLDIPTLARSLNIGYPSFCRAFAHHTGLSPYKYLLETRLATARNLLAESSLSTKEIATRAGFGNTRNFSRLFEEKVGTTPNAWRERAQKVHRHRTAYVS